MLLLVMNSLVYTSGDPDHQQAEKELVISFRVTSASSGLPRTTLQQPVGRGGSWVKLLWMEYKYTAPTQLLHDSQHNSCTTPTQIQENSHTTPGQLVHNSHMTPAQFLHNSGLFTSLKTTLYTSFF